MQRLPMTTTAAPVASAAKQQQNQNDNEDQVHEDSPQMAAAFAGHGDSTAPLSDCSGTARTVASLSVIPGCAHEGIHRAAGMPGKMDSGPDALHRPGMTVVVRRNDDRV